MPKKTKPNLDTIGFNAGLDLRKKLEKISRDKFLTLSELIRNILNDYCESRSQISFELESRNATEKQLKDSKELKDNLEYIYRILKESVDETLYPLKTEMGNLFAEFALNTLQNFYFHKYVLEDKVNSSSLNNEIIRTRKKAIRELKDNTLVKDIFKELSESELI